MARFIPRRVHFGERPVDDDDDDGGEGLPTPKLLRLRARRLAGIREAAETLALLPGPGESLHCLMTARLDMTDVLNALLDKLGRCDTARISTLGLNRRNYRAMLRWLDEGKVGELTLLVSKFFKAHNSELFDEMVEEFRRRRQRTTAVDCHAKVCILSFKSGVRYAIEGSANLCGNGSAREQFAIIHDVDLCSWHSSWIEALGSKHW